MKLFAFDIDNTLYDMKNHIYPHGNVEALSRLQSLGHTVVVATGRPPCKARQILSEGIHPDYLITNNGHCIYTKTGEAFLEKHIPLPLCGDVMTYCKAKGMGLLWSYKDSIHVCSLSEPLEPIIRRNISLPIRYGDDIPLMKGEPIGGCISGKEEEMEKFRKHFCGRIGIVGVNRTYGDLVLHGCSKWSAIEAICLSLGVDRRECMAFGDNQNDREMITNAGIGVCMGNGTDELKSVADHVTADVDRNGITEALTYFGIL